ncbi:potassium channel family protein [Acuticoccus mangrovi]|uniref:Potassium channel family protein n=1 Tax=Acuticoccus mangrovi TaxID=2796142 RepID=A0A934IT31_9HYPH|nr:potassium channel family protein [Acuticoccus mangrovi]MBJ3777174.1 potassium channel family protein [Acuticoccus mangrovi]
MARVGPNTTAPAPVDPEDSRRVRAIRRARELYYGASPASRRFRFALLTFDVLSIAYFVASTVTFTAAHYQWLDFVIGSVLLVDFLVRFAIARQQLHTVRRLSFWIDLVVIVSLFGSALVPNLDYARILRMMRVLRSYRLLVELRRDFITFRQQEEVVESAVNLVVFIFIMTSMVLVVERDTNPDVNTFLDALYFTVATLTTTGFGDIVPTGAAGRLLSIVIMVFGVGLFVRLIQALFRPTKVNYTCPTCGLERHDLDAVHCKHCGSIVNIPTEGAV